MAAKDIVKVNRKTFFNPRAWLGYDFLKAQTALVAQLFNTVFRSPPVEVGEAETFEEAVKRYGLTRSDLEFMQRNYFIMAVLFFSLGIVGIIIGFYFLFTGSFFSFLIMTSLVIFLFAQAFRNHFLFFQIKHHKLGVTLNEWRAKRVKR